MAKLLFSLLGSALLSVTLGYLIGWNEGYVLGLKTGQADALVQAAGKCFLHIERQIK